MADQGAVEIDAATGTDYQDHEQTYHSFIHISKIATGAVVVVLILMAFFLL